MCNACLQVELYLAGEPTTDQIATKWLLKQRGYRVTTVADLPKYLTNGEPDHRGRLAARMVAMLNARAVVLHDGMSAAEVQLLATVCAYTGLRMVNLDDLPLYASDVSTAALNRIAIRLNQRQQRTVRERLESGLNALNQHWLRFEEGFNARCGWFFTNGQKSKQPVPVQYPMAEPKNNVTA